MGNGVALPHARIAGLEKPFGLFALLKPAVQFDAIDERPVDLVFVLLLPELLPEVHLKSMACVARRLGDPILAGKLRTARGGRRSTPCSPDHRHRHRQAPLTPRTKVLR